MRFKSDEFAYLRRGMAFESQRMRVCRREIAVFFARFSDFLGAAVVAVLKKSQGELSR